ncbi:MAG TPA: peptide ABC transporter substrate-binding protein [Thermomicrobiales bacterium]|nr:peptide ABC transporter substrate-binding protein [Thermomicrobiales bacterium]
MFQGNRDGVEFFASNARHLISRRTMLGGSLMAGFGIFGSAMPHGVLAAPSGSGLAARQSFQEVAATPAARQVLVLADDAANSKYIDLFLSAYERPVAAASDLFSEPLVRLNKDFELLPASAESWEGSEDGKTWTFEIREGLTWSDGNPVTANDWVATFQNAASPEMAWDFTWYFQGAIRNWAEAVAGTVGVEEIGVHQGASEYELVFETVAPAPYLPAMLLYSNPLSAAGLAAHGPLYNTDPETAISAGPYILSEWLPDQQITYVRNEAYTGTLPGLVDEVRIQLTTPDNYFTLYQADEIDFMRNPPPAALTIMEGDEATAEEIYSGMGDFPTYYIFFDVTSEPWNDLKVRQAWSHAIDRDALALSILGPNGIPAYSFLAPGFPANNTEGLKEIQTYDPEKAKALLAEAGFENGDGFPKQQLLLRAPSPLEETVAEALAAMIKENLNIDVQVVSQDAQGFMAELTAKPTQIPLGFMRYGMDFFDPYSMLSVWLTGGRHSWSNEEFDTAVLAAGEYLGDPQERMEMFEDAERILVEDVPAVFVYHGTEVQFIKPWLAGEFIEPDKNGVAALHFPVFTTMSTVPAELFIAEGAPER